MILALGFSTGCDQMFDTLGQVKVSVSLDNHQFPLNSQFTLTAMQQGTSNIVTKSLGTLENIDLLPLEPGVWDLVLVAKVNDVEKGRGTAQLTMKPGEMKPVIIDVQYKYDVSFDCNGGSSSTAGKDAVYDSCYGNLPIPTRTGYTFAGWFTQTSGGTKIEETTKYLETANQSLHAQWTANQYTISFDSCGGDSASDMTVNYDSLYGTLPTVSKTNYTFSGWYTGAQGAGNQILAANNVAVTSNTTLHAKWDSIITFDGDGATTTANPATITITDTSLADYLTTLPQGLPLKDGYTFAGWYTGKSGTGSEFTVNTEITGNVTVYAKWTSTVIFDGDGATTPASPSTMTIKNTSGYDYLTSLPVFPPKKDGYMYAGWFTAKYGEGNQFTVKTPVEGNVTVYAKWTSTVTFDGDSATTEANPKTITITDKAGADYLTSLPQVQPARDGYTFAGWYTAKNGGGDPFTTTTEVAGHTTVYAKWTSTVTFDGDGAQTAANPATLAITDTVNADKLTTLPGVIPVKTGYTFDGWFTSKNGGGDPFTIDTEVAGNITVYAKWTGNTYTLSFDSNGGGTVNSQNVTNGFQYGSLPIPTRVGYTLDGWYTGSGGTGDKVLSTDTVSVTSNPTLYAKWIGNDGITYKVEHYKQNLAEDDYVLYETITSTGTAGSSVTASTKTYEGYDVKTTELSANIAGDGSTVIKVYYDLKKFTVIVYENGGSDVDNLVNVKYGSKITAPNTIRAGFHIRYWATQNTPYASIDLATYEVKSNINLYALWQYNEDTPYKIEHYKQKDSLDGYELFETESLTGRTDSAVTATKQAYVGYMYKEGTLNSTIAADGNLVMKLYYDKAAFNVTFDSKEGTPVTGLSNVAANTTIQAPSTDPTRTGYTFGGWYKEDTCTNQWNFASDTVTEVKTLYAKWTGIDGIKYTVNHYLQGTDPTKYTLNSNDNLTGVAGSTVTITPNTYTQYLSQQSTVTGTIAGDGSTVIEIKYDRKKYWVTFNENGGTDVDNIAELTYGTKIPQPSITRDGYTLACWSTSSLTADAWSFGGRLITSDTTLNALWKSKVTFNNEDATTASDPTFIEIIDTSGADVITQLPTAPLRTGYTFGEWHIGSVAGFAFTTSTEITGNITVYPSWHADSTVTFNSNDGTAVSAITNVAYNAKISEPTAPTLANKVFGGWFKDQSTMQQQWDFAVDTVKTDITLYAKWRDFQVGDVGPAGGYVIYDKGQTTDGWRYIELAPASANIDAKRWVNDFAYNDIGSLNEGIGYGESNTSSLNGVFGSGADAAFYCSILSVSHNGIAYEDWYLPSVDELKWAYKVVSDASMNNRYWSSNKDTSNPSLKNAKGIDFREGSFESPNIKAYVSGYASGPLTRAIRYF